MQMTEQELNIKIKTIAKHGLGKWPQMLVTGKNVTVDQAKEIIFCTDPFFTDAYCYSGGNDKKFNENYRKISGLDTLVVDGEPHDAADPQTDWDAVEELRKILGVFAHEYVATDWGSSCFIYGPHGWCHPDGRIHYEDNIGKWPSIEQVYAEWSEVAKKFPFLDLTVTLMNDERLAPERLAVINLRVLDGEVSLEAPDDSMHTIEFDDDREFAVKETGLPESWYVEFAAIVKAGIDKYRKTV
jgi:hypothetical protein